VQVGPDFGIEVRVLSTRLDVDLRSKYSTYNVMSYEQHFIERTKKPVARDGLATVVSEVPPPASVPKLIYE